MKKRPARPSARALAIQAAALVALVTVAAPSAEAQLVSKPDDRWRYALGAGLTAASGNSDSIAVNLTMDAVVQNVDRKVTFYGRGVYGKNDEIVSNNHSGLGGRRDQELSGPYFAFASLDWFRDRLANLSYRATTNGGVGYHLFKQDTDFWDVFGGVGYTRESFTVPTEIEDGIRTSYGHFEALIGTESQHALSETTSFKQRLAIFPNLDRNGEYRATFDAGFAVSMTRQLALTATFSLRRNSDPGTGINKNDRLFVTGVTFRTD